MTKKSCVLLHCTLLIKFVDSKNVPMQVHADILYSRVVLLLQLLNSIVYSVSYEFNNIAQTIVGNHSTCSFTLHMYRGQFDWQNLVFMNMHEAGKTNLIPMKLHVTIKYSLITMMSYWDFLT